VKQVALVRDRVVTRVIDMLEHLRVQLSMLPETDYDVLRLIERPQQFEVAVDVANFVMVRLGGPETAPKDPRFDKTRRVVAKKRGRPPRGEKPPEPEVVNG
jgi:hypothetical protein